MNPAVAPDTESSPGPGSMLRRARESLGLTEQEAAEQLNLDVTVIAALERDDFASLGAPVFAKGHLRRYGTLLGLVEDDLLAAYEHARGQPEAPTLIPRARQEMVPVRGRPKWPWVLGGTLLFVVGAGLVALLSEYGLPWPFGRNAESADDTAGVVVPAPAGAADVAGAADGSGPETAPAAAPVEPAAAALPVPPGHVSVSLAFSADSWVEIYDGSGKAVLYDLGRAGSQRTIAAAAPLSVTLGNGPAVTVRVNGGAAAIPAVPSGGTVARFRIQADGTVR